MLSQLPDGICQPELGLRQRICDKMQIDILSCINWSTNPACLNLGSKLLHTPPTFSILAPAEESKTSSVDCLLFVLLFLPDQLDDGGEEGHADQDVDGADQHVRSFLWTRKIQRSYPNKNQVVAYVFWILSQIWRKKQKGFYARTCTKTTLSRKLFARWKTTLQIDHSRFFRFVPSCKIML